MLSLFVNSSTTLKKRKKRKKIGTYVLSTKFFPNLLAGKFATVEQMLLKEFTYIGRKFKTFEQPLK